MKFECAGDCTLGTSFKNITLLSLKEEIAIKSCIKLRLYFRAL